MFQQCCKYYHNTNALSQDHSNTCDGEITLGKMSHLQAEREIMLSHVQA